MRRAFSIVTMLAAWAGLALVLWPNPGAQAAADAPMTDAEMRALIERVIASQHRNDAALMEYERREHHRTWKTEERQRSEEDKLFRVVPTGTGTVKLTLAENGHPFPAAEYRKQLAYLEQGLRQALAPNDPEQKKRIQKWEKRSRERAEAVDAIARAYRFTWLGRETLDGRALVKLRFDAVDSFDPGSRVQDLLKHSQATVWIDPAAAQLARIEAELVRDYSIIGGIVGKVYKGSRFVMEQRPVAAGVWLPTLLRYDFKGRKFVFSAEVHEEVRASDYRRIGPPAEALAAVRRELNASPKPAGSQ
jgi:hypothetical protein